jgi:hypothetical protein
MNSMEQKTPVFYYFNVQEFYLWGKGIHLTSQRIILESAAPVASTVGECLAHAQLRISPVCPRRM